MLIPFGVLSAAGAGLGFESDYELISTEILGSSQASVTFSSLGDYSSTYKHLQIRFTARLDLNATSNPIVVRANGVTSSSYSAHQLNAGGGAVDSAAFTSTTAMRLGRATGATGTANNFGAAVIDILDPYSTSKNTTFRSLTGISTEVITLFSGLFINTASITSFELLPLTSSNFVAGSRFSLYGIKG
jgi:hypothetical protein